MFEIWPLCILNQWFSTTSTEVQSQDSWCADGRQQLKWLILYYGEIHSVLAAIRYAQPYHTKAVLIPYENILYQIPVARVASCSSVIFILSLIETYLYDVSLWSLNLKTTDAR